MIVHRLDMATSGLLLVAKTKEVHQDLQAQFANRSIKKRYVAVLDGVIVVGAGADAVDYKLISICHKGDVVVSQDYGVAAMALGKGAYVIHQSGKWYTNENIDQMLMERHLKRRQDAALIRII